MQDNWDHNLAVQVKRKFENYKIFRLDLSTARTDYRFDISGDLIYVEKVSSESATATIKLGRNTNDALDLYLHRKIRTLAFTEIYITNTAQTGEWFEFVIGINFDIESRYLGKHRSARPIETITNAVANTNTVGSNIVCDVVLIKADVYNTQTVWIDFNNAAVQNACYPLDPHETIRVKIDNLNQINANFEVANENLFICYEV